MFIVAMHVESPAQPIIEKDAEAPKKLVQLPIVESIEHPIAQPSEPSYKDPFGQVERLERILPFYRVLAHPHYPAWSYRPFKIKDRHPSILALRKQLRMLGFPSQKNQIFDADLSKTIHAFQKYARLPQNGQINASLWRTLHQRHKISSLESTLEKWKKITPYMKGQFIFVHLPKYKLYAFSDHHLNLTQRIIIGRRERPTPELTPTWMTHVVLNPSWTLPPTILLQDKLHKIKSDPSYLTRNGYTVQNQNGRYVNPRQVNWHMVSKYYMPYSIKLPPSESNPLGDIKFHLRNSGAIFMHGTPQDLFYKRERALSSGCIRVEDEYELASWALYKNSSDETIQKLIQKVDKKTTQHITLQSQIPVLITNITSWIDRHYRIQKIKSPY